MNKKIPFTPNETDALLYVLLSLMILFSVNQVFSQSQPFAHAFETGNNVQHRYSWIAGDKCVYVDRVTGNINSCEIVQAIGSFGQIQFFVTPRKLFMLIEMLCSPVRLVKISNLANTSGTAKSSRQTTATKVQQMYVDQAYST